MLEQYHLTLVESTAIHNVYQREADYEGVVELCADDKIGIKNQKLGYWKTFTLGSVVSNALQNGKCPIQKLAQATERGDPLHWIIADSTVISDTARLKVQVIAVEVGTLVRFQGRLFTLESAANNNLRFSPAKLVK